MTDPVEYHVRQCIESYKGGRVNDELLRQVDLGLQEELVDWVFSLDNPLEMVEATLYGALS